MNFLSPDWFYALLVIPCIIIAAIIMQMNRAQIWRSLTAQRHEVSLVKKHRRIMHWISFSCAILAITLLVFAMARPYHGQTEQRAEVETRNVLIAVDTSLSMLCDDVQPTRLDRAISISNNIVDQLPNEHIALMAFAGTANVLSPFTVNGKQLKNDIAALTPLSTSKRGSDLPNAIDVGIDMIKSTGQFANAMIILTDGAETSESLDRAIEKAKKYDVQIFCIGIGTKVGGTITVNGRKHRDSVGRVVTTKLEDNALRQLARGTSGFYTTYDNSPSQIIQRAIEKMSTFEKQGRIRQTPNELYQWFLGAGVLFLLISAMFRAHWRMPRNVNTSLATYIIVAFLLFSQTHSAQAEGWLDNTSKQLFEKPALKKKAYQALEDGKNEDAIKLFQKVIPDTQGNERADLSLALAQAYYREKNYKAAASAYSKAMLSSDRDTQSEAQYNLANSIYQHQMKDIEVPEGMDFEIYFDNALKGENGVPKMSKDEMRSLKSGLADAQEHFSDVSESDSPSEQAKENLALTDKTIAAIDKALNKKDPPSSPPPSDQQDQNNNSDNQDDKGEQNSPENNQSNKDDSSDEKSDPKSGDQGNSDENRGDSPNENGNQSDEGEQDQENPPKNNNDPQNGDSKKPAENNENKESKTPPKQPKQDSTNPEESSDSPEGDNKEPSDQQPKEGTKPNNKESQPNSTGKIEENSKPNGKSNKDRKPGELSPLEFLEKHSDLQIKPPKRRPLYERHPKVDW